MKNKFCLRRSAVLLLLLVTSLLSIAQKNISGKILSSKDQTPIPGITITVKGTRSGTATGVDGSFTLPARPGDVLIFSGVGIKSGELNVEEGKSNYVISVDQ